jgi:predicted metalloprotease with PDZ domain
MAIAQSSAFLLQLALGSQSADKGQHIPRAMRTSRFFACALILLCARLSAFAAPAKDPLPPARLDVDATDAPRKILHARLVVPAKPGKLTLVYPKWIPGEHGPTGPVTDLAGLKLTAGGKPIPWQRDPVDMFAFHCEVPAGASAVEATFDFLLPTKKEGFSSGASSTAYLAVLSWNQVLLYPQGAKTDELIYKASLRLPTGWKYGTALPAERESAAGIEFDPVSLTTLVDSPVAAGVYFRTIRLSPGKSPRPAHLLHLVSDSAAALEISPELTAQYSQLVLEANALFGAHHYGSYHFLLTLSDQVPTFGLEHHESSDNRASERFLLDDDPRKTLADLLPHEMTHSWNGKFRRPADLATPDFQQPMRTELLWVYEGLTHYLGYLLTARCGLWTNETYREGIALAAARLDTQPGRAWRPLADTAVAAQLLYNAAPEWAALRRGVDFYEEGWLIWLEADVTIRKLTQGKRSLDDFCRRFHGGQSGPPAVSAYTFDDVVKALNEVAPHDWRGFFDTRVNKPAQRAPLGGIEGSGWKLVYTDGMPALLKAQEGADKFTDLSYSIGLAVKEDGGIKDVVPGMAAEKAGVSPGMKLIAVNGRKWSADILRAAVKATRSERAPLELLLENSQFYRTYSLDYHEGERYPHLERDASKPDLLEQILKPLTPRVDAGAKGKL